MSITEVRSRWKKSSAFRTTERVRHSAAFFVLQAKDSAARAAGSGTDARRGQLPIGIAGCKARSDGVGCLHAFFRVFFPVSSPSPPPPAVFRTIYAWNYKASDGLSHEVRQQRRQLTRGRRDRRRRWTDPPFLCRSALSSSSSFLSFTHPPFQCAVRLAAGDTRSSARWPHSRRGCARPLSSLLQCTAPRLS